MVDTTIVDFTNCPIDTAAQYGGSDQKRGVFYRNARYMLQFADRICADNRNVWNSSYSNSIFSEKVCCDILCELGFPVQHVLIGYVAFGNEKKPVVACENFVPMGAVLISFKTIANSVLPSKLGKLPKLSEIYAVLTEPSPYFSKESGNKALRAYWDLFILDAFLGNFDRHGDNWSYFSVAGTSEMQIAPIYDCGSCLYPQIFDEGISAILADEHEINTRVDVFPTAALILNDGHKANYKDFIASGANSDCTDALLRVFPRIDMSAVQAVVDAEPISEIRKHFYKTMLEARYNRILVPVYERFSRFSAKTHYF